MRRLVVSQSQAGHSWWSSGTCVCTWIEWSSFERMQTHLNRWIQTLHCCQASDYQWQSEPGRTGWSHPSQFLHWEENNNSVQQVQWITGKGANANQLACQLKQINTIVLAARLFVLVMKESKLYFTNCSLSFTRHKANTMLSYHELHSSETSCWISGLRHILI